MNKTNSVYKKLFEMKQYIGKVVKDKENKFTNSRFTDINGILEHTEPALQECGLLIVDEIAEETLHTKLIDPDTGDFIESVATLVMVKQDPQAYMSSLSYMRRANRVALLGIEQIDDDGAIASGQSFAKPKQIKEIQELLLSTNTDAAKFLAHYKVSSVKDMYETTANDALKTLKLKKQKIGETTNEK